MCDLAKERKIKGKGGKQVLWCGFVNLLARTFLENSSLFRIYEILFPDVLIAPWLYLNGA